MNLKEKLTNIAKKAHDASRKSFSISTALKNKALKEMASSLITKKDYILKANREDVRRSRLKRLSPALIDRLSLSETRIRSMADSLLEIARQKDPVGEVIKEWTRPNGLRIQKVRIPIGVIAIIYESRPNVTSECIGLCLKSGNSVILRGGSEALNSNKAIYGILMDALARNGLSPNSVNLVTTSDRQAVDILLKLNKYIDLVIPRGGEGLINHVVKSSRIPVIKHYKGICHVYIDWDADLNMAQDICYNAKVQRPAVCNAMESMLVHIDVAARFLPEMARKFREAHVQMRGCPITRKIIKDALPATQKDYRTEYLGLILSIKVVKDLDEAINHINEYGSHHSDTIVTDNEADALKFLKQVDSACVYVNASTRFTDGYQFGMGAEMGISTEKIHCRGPMALEELTTYKYKIYGNGQVRE